ncbi:hypothetical protein GQ55_9G175600 [Panicum hallii var. hallii]|nr:hypothetical protein GQ55_9G175600 [Panicum hallii var. hallii]
MGSAVETLCGQAYGAHRYEMLGVYMQRSFVPLAAVYAFSRPILVLLGESPEIAAAAAVFVLGLIPQIFAYAANFPIQKSSCAADFHSRRKSSVPYSPNLPMLKTAAESYTRRIYSEFETEFKDQFLLTGQLLNVEGSILTYMVRHIQSDQGATVVFNIENMTITCSCRKYESIGILCNHALKVFNIKDVFILPSEYILNRWTKYAKREFFVEKYGIEKENLTTQAARISRKATSVALKCSLSKELLDDLKNTIDKLNLDADNSIIKVQEKANELPPVSAYCSTDTLTGKISFRVPRIVKGLKKKKDPSHPLKRERGRKTEVPTKTKVLIQNKQWILMSVQLKLIVCLVICMTNLQLWQFHQSRAVMLIP